MAGTIAATDPQTGFQGLLVEVHSTLTTVPEDVRRALEERMFLRNVRVGIIVTPTALLVLRDTLSSMDFSDNRYEFHTLATPALFKSARVGSPQGNDAVFVQQVVRFLEAIGSSWYTYLHESAVSAMVPDVIGNLAGASLEVWDGLLDRSDAAE